MTTIDPSNLIKALERRSKRATAEGLPYFAVVTGVNGNLVAVTATSATTAATEEIARLAGIAVVGDYGIVIPVAGGSLVFARIAPSAAPGTEQVIPINVPSPAVANTINTGTYVAKVLAQPVIPAGTWGCAITGTGVIWRSTNAGDMRARLRVGGVLTHEVVFATADGLNLTVPVTANMSIIRSDTASPIVLPTAGALDFEIAWRGGSVAGTTYLLNAQISGFLYRLS